MTSGAWARTAVCAATSAALAIGSLGLLTRSHPPVTPPQLLSEAVAVADDGVHPIRPGSTDQLVPGTRVLDDAGNPQATERLVQAEEARLGTTKQPAKLGGNGFGAPERPDEFSEPSFTALQDLFALTRPNGAVLAGGVGAWRYVWPRDASFAIAAYAATGHTDLAIGTLGFLQRVQGIDGRFAARYHPDGRPVDDGRAPQLDGSGWALWALDRLAHAQASNPAKLAETLTQFRPLLDRSTAAILASLDSRSLPEPSSDYWEHAESHLTLGTAAPLLAGLQAAQRCYELLGASRTDVDDAARRLAAAIKRHFAPTYGRYPGVGAADAAIAFLQEPFVSFADDDARVALNHAWAVLQRPAGGIAPGEAWPRDGISWTPETALFAYTFAADGEEERAREVLRWLSGHRTRLGALPEKVRADGAPASVAPLAWTCALFLLTADELD